MSVVAYVIGHERIGFESRHYSGVCIEQTKRLLFALSSFFKTKTNAAIRSRHGAVNESYTMLIKVERLGEQH